MPGELAGIFSVGAATSPGSAIERRTTLSLSSDSTAINPPQYYGVKIPLLLK